MLAMATFKHFVVDSMIVLGKNDETKNKDIIIYCMNNAARNNNLIFTVNEFLSSYSTS